MQPLSKSLNKIFGGSKPTDNGNLVLNEETYSLAVEDPIARKFVHPFRMGEELVKGIERWCLWLEGVSEEEIRNSNFLFQQILKVREFRLGSKKLATRKKAESPHLFDERRQPKTDYLAVPVVVSENRPYFTAALLSSDVIAGNKLFTASDPDGFLFSIISSSMFIAWQRAIGGRLESRLSFSNTIVWNTLPLPPVPEDLRARIIAAGKKILAAREAIEERAGSASAWIKCTLHSKTWILRCARLTRTWTRWLTSPSVHPAAAPPTSSASVSSSIVTSNSRVLLRACHR